MPLAQLICNNIPVLRLNDSGNKALQLMDDFKISHLPVVAKNGNYIGLVSDNDIYNLNDSNLSVENCGIYPPQPYVYDSQFVYDALNVITTNKLSILPVTNLDNKYLGSITEQTLLLNIAEITSSNKQGGTLVLETRETNYSSAVISGIIESYNLKILSIYAHTPKKSKTTEIVVKVNGHDTSGIMQGLERNGYIVKNIYNGDKKYSQLMEERYDAFINYINV